MTRAVLSIGTNLGDRLANLRLALDGLGAAVTAVSGVYATAPWGGVEQPDFYNVTVLVQDPELDEWGWLRLGQALEEQAHRVRDVRWGPRTLDVDVITCFAGTAELSSDDPELLLPHPRARERAFVLAPWLDVEPDAAIAGTPIASLLAALPAAERDGVRRVQARLGASDG